MLNLASSHSASTTSCSLRFTVRSGSRKRFLAKLLAHGRAALDDPARLVVGHHGAAQADGVDAEMAVETAVLDGDHGLRQIDRQLVDPDLIAEECAALGEDIAIGGEHDHARLALRNPEQALGFERKPHIGREPGQYDKTPHAQRCRPAEQPEEERAAARFARARRGHRARMTTAARPAGRPGGARAQTENGKFPCSARTIRSIMSRSRPQPT